MERGRRPLSRPALPARRDHQLAPAAARTPSPDHGRRGWGEEDPAAGRAVRRPCNLFAGGPGAGPDEVGAKLKVLRAHCARLGTDFDSIRKSILWTGPLEVTAAGGTAFAEALRPYAEVGVDEVHVMPFTGDPVAFVNGLGEHVVGPLNDVL
ncbi:hypothetical protein OG555_05575 [Kribbella sp. NBC_01484]|nr:hypothetical protein [Kribbella sp. NBC_01484]